MVKFIERKFLPNPRFNCRKAGYIYTIKEKKANIQEENTMSDKIKVLDAMKAAGKPVSAGEVVKLTELDKKIVDKAFKELKAEGAIVSPVRCKWEPAEK